MLVEFLVSRSQWAEHSLSPVDGFSPSMSWISCSQHEAVTCCSDPIDCDRLSIRSTYSLGG